MAFGILLTLFGVGAACVQVYNCMVYALPVAVGLWTGLALLHAGAGAVVASGAGFLAGVFVFVVGTMGFHASRSAIIGYAIATPFVLSAVSVG